MRQNWQVMALVLAIGCASAQHDPLYDSDLLYTSADNVTMIPVVIENNRDVNEIAPVFYMLGIGRHSLGRVEGMAMRRVYVDRKWFPADGCVRIGAHYVGIGDWVSDKFCWYPGQFVDVKLQVLINTSNAWAHR